MDLVLAFWKQQIKKKFEGHEVNMDKNRIS